MIEFKGVSKTYDSGTKALHDVNLTITKGDFVFIVGSSGAGKSTFLKLIMREEKSSSGEVFVNGFNLNKLKRSGVPKLRRTMGIVFQDFRLIPKMSVYDNVAFAMRVIGKSEREIRKRVPYVLNLVNLGPKARSFPHELSGGEQQRISLARALINNPSLIIADEPTGNVDPEMAYEIVNLLKKINEKGTTVIMVTHAHDLVRYFGGRIIVVEGGSIASDMLTECETQPSQENEVNVSTNVNDIDNFNIDDGNVLDEYEIFEQSLENIVGDFDNPSLDYTKENSSFTDSLDLFDFDIDYYSNDDEHSGGNQ